MPIPLLPFIWYAMALMLCSCENYALYQLALLTLVHLCPPFSSLWSDSTGDKISFSGLVVPFRSLLLGHVTVPYPPWYYMSNLTLTSQSLAMNCVVILWISDYMIIVPFTAQMAHSLTDPKCWMTFFFINEYLWESWKDGSSHRHTSTPHRTSYMQILSFFV